MSSCLINVSNTVNLQIHLKTGKDEALRRMKPMKRIWILCIMTLLVLKMNDNRGKLTAMSFSSSELISGNSAKDIHNSSSNTTRRNKLSGQSPSSDHFPRNIDLFSM